MKNRRDHYTENRESSLEIERTRKELAFAVERGESKNKRISKVAYEGAREKGWTGVAGNKRLANPRRQFNLAANPRENVNKDLATTSATLFRPAASRGTRVLARVQRHFIFAQRYRRWPAPTTWKLCAKRAVPAVRFSFPASRLYLYLLSSATPFGLPPS